MELLQAVSNLNNKNADIPVTMGDSKLYFDSDNVRCVLKLYLLTDDNVKEVKFDVCGYGEDGYKVNLMTDIPYINGGMLLEIPSLMAKQVEVTVRSVILKDGEEITDDTPFDERINTSGDDEGTCRYDFSELADSEDYENEDFEESEEYCEDDVYPDEEYYDEDYDEYYDEEEVEKRHLSRKERKELRRRRIAEEEEIREFLKKDPTERKKRLIKRIITIVVLAGVAVGGFYGYAYKDRADTVYKKGMNLYNSGKFSEAVPVLEEAQQYIYLGDKKKELDWSLAMCYARERDFFNGAKYFKKLVGYSEASENYRSVTEAFSGIVGAGKFHSVGLCNDGRVVAAGSGDKSQTKVDSWRDITEIAAGGEHTLGLRDGGTVAATGDNASGQCNVTSWKNIMDIAAGNAHSVGVENTGRVVATGDDSMGQCNVNEWSGIVSVAAGYTHTVGLKIDGTVVATGSNANGECNVSKWNNVVQVAAGNGFTVGLTYNGKVLFAGDKSRGANDATKAKDAMFVSAGAYNVLVTDINGHTTAYGGNDSKQCVTDLWRSIVASNGGENHSVGISADGTAFGAGGNDKGQISLDDWSNIGIPSGTVTIRKGQE